MLDPKRAQNWVTRKLSPARQNTFGGLLPPQPDRLNVPGTSDSAKNRSNSDTKIKPSLEPDEQLPTAVSPNIARKTKEAIQCRVAQGDVGSSPSAKNSWLEKLRQKSIDIPAPFRFVAQSSGSSSDSPKLVQQDSLDIPEITLDPPSSTSSQPTVQVQDMPLSSMKGPFPQLPKKLRKPGEPVYSSQWKPVTASSGLDVTGLWVRVDGKELRLTGLQLDSLGRFERYALQKVAILRLQRANLGCNIVRPKDDAFPSKNKHQKYVRRKAHTVNVIESRLTKSKQLTASTSQPTVDEPNPAGGRPVFGVPLAHTIAHHFKQADLNRFCKSVDTSEIDSTKSKSGMSRLSTGHSSPASVSDVADEGTPERSDSNEQLDESLSGRSTIGRPDSLQVPQIVQTCIQYLQQNGLSVIGLFRVAGSVKRCRQLKIDLEAGGELFIRTDDEEGLEHYPHDIATLLKEFFRDLPQPLLTTELYPAFLEVTKLPDHQKVPILRLLACLLPVANCDTLLFLLKFLKEVARHAYDTIGDQGVVVRGNRMTTLNLATIFGPTVLRPGATKGPTLVESDLAISCLQQLIENAEDIVKIPAELQHATYKYMYENDPHSLDLTLDDLHERSQRKVSARNPEAPVSTLTFQSKEEEFPVETKKERDGTTVMKTKEITTHRITYRVRKSDDPALDERFPELNLFIDDSPGNSESQQGVDLLDPSKFAKQRKPIIFSKRQ